MALASGHEMAKKSKSLEYFEYLCEQKTKLQGGTSSNCPTTPTPYKATSSTDCKQCARGPEGNMYTHTCDLSIEERQDLKYGPMVNSKAELQQVKILMVEVFNMLTPEEQKQIFLSELLK